MAMEDLHQAMTALTEELATGRWTPHSSECALASRVAAGLQTAAGDGSDRSGSARALPEIVRDALRTVGPDVATPYVTDGRFAAIVVRCAALLEPARLAATEDGQRLAAQLLQVCGEVTSLQPVPRPSTP
ncbi:hypothetical protein AB0L54_34155 [Streptomyces sp. NPDC052196]|uniref:hypothetical protein n=1 Tax=Streptomyces sp. NPDC052196 TaxID=3156691 RepID=UPI00342D231F